MHAVFRRYRIRLGAVEAAAERAHEGLVPDLRRVQGFAAYYLVHAGNDTLASIALFQTEESAAVGERLLNDWFRHDWPVFRSEERRVGKEGRSRWSPDHLKKKKA